MWFFITISALFAVYQLPIWMETREQTYPKMEQTLLLEIFTIRVAYAHGYFLGLLICKNSEHIKWTKPPLYSSNSDSHHKWISSCEITVHELIMGVLEIE